MTQKKWSKVLQYYAEFSLCGGKVGWGHVTNPMNLPHSAARIPKVLQHFFNLGKVWKHGRFWTTASIMFKRQAFPENCFPRRTKIDVFVSNEVRNGKGPYDRPKRAKNV